MLTKLALSPLFAPVLQSIILGILTAAFMSLRKYFATHAKVSALSAVADAFEKAMDAAVKSNPSGTPAQQAAAAWKVAETHLQASWPDIEKALGVELSVVLGSHAAITAGTPVTAPGGATVTLPSPVKIAVLLLACLLPFHAKAQEAPPTPDRWELAILTPGLRFDLTGTAPVEVAAQSGVGFDYLFGKLLFTTPQGAKLPWLGFSFFAQGGLDVSNLGESENAAIGVGCIILDSVTIGWYVDLAAGGPTGKASGLFTGNMTLGNTGPELFYSLPVSVL